jgi:hypothetical protein
VVRRASRVARGAVLVVFNAFGGIWSCSIFTDLDVQGYSLAGGDGGAASDASAFQASCGRSADCQGGARCCYADSSLCLCVSGLELSPVEAGGD